MPVDPKAAATIIAAFIAAFVALMTVIITKEQKVSEFRQAWIDHLREDIAESISAASTLTLDLHSERDAEALLREWARLTAALARVDLRLNLNERSHQQLEQWIRKTETAIREAELIGPEFQISEWLDLQAEALAICRPLLKSEWDRVREGEPLYRAAKVSLIVIVLFAPIISLFSYICAQN